MLFIFADLQEVDSRRETHLAWHVAVRDRIPPPRRVCTGSGIRIRIQNPDLDYFQNVT